MTSVFQSNKFSKIKNAPCMYVILCKLRTWYDEKVCFIKVKDASLYDKMSELQRSYPVQSRLEYLKKVVKYSMLYLVLNKPQINYTLRMMIQVPLNICKLSLESFVFVTLKI